MLEGQIVFNPYFDEFDEDEISDMEDNVNKAAVHRVFDETINAIQLNETIFKACIK